MSRSASPNSVVALATRATASNAAVSRSRDSSPPAPSPLMLIQYKRAPFPHPAPSGVVVTRVGAGAPPPPARQLRARLETGRAVIIEGEDEVARRVRPLDDREPAGRAAGPDQPELHRRGGPPLEQAVRERVEPPDLVDVGEQPHALEPQLHQAPHQGAAGERLAIQSRGHALEDPAGELTIRMIEHLRAEVLVRGSRAGTTGNPKGPASVARVNSAR